MAIYSKSITALATADLQELLTEQAVENIRLEFKSVAPDKDDTLKKLSSFANTYGGYVVIGAQDDGHGRLQALPGVDLIDGYRQKIVQWCYDSVWPPLEVFVSDPIPTPQDAAKVCYVIEMPLSAEAPHFINGRKGAYVRTDEFSQRFEPQLATYEELTHLGNRRAQLIERRENLLKRSLARFDTYVQTDYKSAPNTKGAIGATLFVAVSPQFPHRQLVEHSKLISQFETHHIPWRQTGFPVPNMPKISAHESLLIPGAAYRFSLAEITQWGHLFYGVEFEEAYHDNPRDKNEVARGIHSNAFVGYLLIFLEHARSALKLLGYEGPLVVTLRMVRIRGMPFLAFSYNTPEPVGGAPFDDTLSIEVETSTRALEGNLKKVMGEIARMVFFALNWPSQALGDGAVEQIIKKGEYYNTLR
jgi:hypothetical protein